MNPEPIIFPKTTPRWLRERVMAMEREIENLNKKQERVNKQLWKNQEEFQDLLDLVEKIAKEETIDEPVPWAIRTCRNMVNRFNPGSYNDDVS